MSATVESVRQLRKPYRSVLTENAKILLGKRYLEPGESIDGMFRRVSGGNEEYYNRMSQLDFLPNSPTLMNANTGRKATLSACYVLNVEDSMLDGSRSIMGTACKATAIARASGGVGYSLSNIRPRGALIKSTHRAATGPVNVLRFYNEIANLVTQGGRRHLAQMGILRCDHPDIREFIHVKDKDPQRLNAFNISVAITDKFITASTKTGTEEYKLWGEICKSAWTSGDPGIIFIDGMNRDNPTPWLGDIEATNPCSEVPLLDSEACNLLSINLANFTVDGEVDWYRLETAVSTATRFLDHIIDINNHPHPDITKAVALTRKIGLGVMGWADMLALLGIHYDTDEAVELGGRIMKFIQEISHATSIKLAEENGGPYPASRGDPKRNATCTCIAPTGSISIIAGASSGIEPHFAIEWERTMGDGTKLQEKIPVYEALEGFRPKTAMEIPFEWHVKHQAAFQKYTDLAVSKTINLPNSATVEDVSNAYRMMYDLGCKGGTVFRDGCREGGEQVLVAKSGSSKVPNASKDLSTLGSKSYSPKILETLVSGSNREATRSIQPALHMDAHSCRSRLPDERQSLTHKFSVGGVEGYLTVGLYENGTPGELFVTVAKEGSTVSGLLDSWATSISLNLQYGSSISDLASKFSGTRFEPSGMTKNKDIPVATSIVDYIVRWLDLKFGSGKKGVKQMIMGSGMLCQECHSVAIYHGGCLTCSNMCGWSRCG